MKIKAVLDANVLISAFIAPGGPPSQILKSYSQGGFRLFLCPGILEETRRALLEYNHIRDKYDYEAEQVTRFLKDLRKGSIVVTELPEVKVIEEDPDDNKILACGQKGGVDYISSGDSHLKELGAYKEIEILPPATFLEVIEEKEER